MSPTRMQRIVSIIVVAAATATSACGSTETTTVSAQKHGEELFSDPTTSSSNQNVFSCASCHVADKPPSNDPLLPGAALAGVVRRPTFWGGAESDLLQAVNSCRVTFMLAPKPWTADDPDAQAIWAYLGSLPETRVGAIPFTVVHSAVDLPAGDADAGRALYDRACASCHGAVHTGTGNATPLAVVLPDAPLRGHLAAFDKSNQRLAFIEKIRHGGFLGYTGSMPPFSSEALADTDVANLLSFLGLY